MILHAREPGRLDAVRDLLDRGAQAAIGDLSDVQQIRLLAEQVNRLGRPDAVIHNAGMFTGPQVMPVNVIAPYLLTALIERPKRIVYLSSSMHFDGVPELNGVDWPRRRSGFLFGQQAVRHRAGRRRGAPVA